MINVLNIVTQVADVKDLLTTESITVIGLLLGVCALLIWDKNKEAKKYADLLSRFDKEQEKSKEVLIELVSKYATATEQNTQAINTIKDVYTKNGN